LTGRGKAKAVLACVSRKTYGVILKAGFMAEESCGKARKNQILHSVQNDKPFYGRRIWHLRVLRIKSEILPHCAPQDDR